MIFHQYNQSMCDRAIALLRVLARAVTLGVLCIHECHRERINKRKKDTRVIVRRLIIATNKFSDSYSVLLYNNKKYFVTLYVIRLK